MSRVKTQNKMIIRYPYCPLVLFGFPCPFLSYCRCGDDRSCCCPRCSNQIYTHTQIFAIVLDSDCIRTNFGSSSSTAFGWLIDNTSHLTCSKSFVTKEIGIIISVLHTVSLSILGLRLLHSSVSTNAVKRI